MIHINVKGIEGFNEMVNRLGRPLTDKEMAGVTKFGLTVVKTQMQFNVPKRSWGLYYSIKIEKDRNLSRFGKMPVFRVGRTIKNFSATGRGYHAHLIEYGTKRGVKAQTPFSRAINAREDQAIALTKQALERFITERAKYR